MAKNKNTYKCLKCNSPYSKWQGQCITCKEWNTIEEFQENLTSGSKYNASKRGSTLLKDVKVSSTNRTVTGITEFDRVVGGGLVDDSISILTAAPGAGKSTLCLMISDKMISLGKKVLYASGEESASQIKSRAERLKLKNSGDIRIIDDSNLDNVINEIIKEDIDFLVLDSIQTYYLNEFLPSRPGNPTQTVECADAILNLCKRGSKKMSAFLICQVTKNDDELAGPKALEHLVDSCFRIDGDSDDSLRILQSTKNRFGNTGETGFFNMTETGLECIDNPSEYFMTTRKEPIIGTSLTVVKEGSRAIIAEVESIVSKSFTPFPSRIGEALKKEQLNILISILEQRASINLYDKNVVIKTSGGIKLGEPSCNLAILMTIASSFYKKAINMDIVFIGDVGLTGEIKKVPNLETRLKELDRLGYKKAYVAKGAVNKSLKLKGLEIVEKNTLKDVITDLF